MWSNISGGKFIRLRSLEPSIIETSWSLISFTPTLEDMVVQEQGDTALSRSNNVLGTSTWRSQGGNAHKASHAWFRLYLYQGPLALETNMSYRRISQPPSPSSLPALLLGLECFCRIVITLLILLKALITPWPVSSGGSFYWTYLSYHFEVWTTDSDTGIYLML